MTRDQLIGTWRCRQTNSIIELRSDGTGSSRVVGQGGRMHNSRFEWSYIDQTHWRLEIHIDPVPHIPSLEHGTVEGIDYEIVAVDGTTMSLRQFDVEFAWVWEKIG